MESWKIVLRNGLFKILTKEQLLVGLEALKTDSPLLTQGSTTTPPPLMCVQDWPVEAACFLGFCGWKNPINPLETVGQVEEFFAKCCFEMDQRLGEPAACRWFLNWFDETPRNQMREALIAEIEEHLSMVNRDGIGTNVDGVEG